MWQVKSIKSYKSAREQYISYNLWVSANYIVTNNSHSVNAVVEIENFPAKNLSGRNSRQKSHHHYHHHTGIKATQ